MGFERMGRWSRMLSWALLASASGACSRAGESDDVLVEREETGTLTLPLVSTSASGTVYALRNATFLVRTGDGAPVRTLSSDDEPDAERVSTRLDIGDYTVELLGDWVLERRTESGFEAVAATLASPSSVPISIGADVETSVVFELVVGPDGSTGPGGSLGIGIAVREGESCGNGVLDPGEVCDDGAGTGTANGCDHSCLFVCQGACPLRVDPGAGTSGDGKSWPTALVSVSAAVEEQFARGGGEVWVRGPGPYERLAARPSAPLLRLAPGVAVIGGFSGMDERPKLDRTAQTTLAGAARGEVDAIAPLVIGASNSRLEGFRITGHGGPVLQYRDARVFTVASVTLEGNAHFDSHAVEVTGSTGRFEFLRILDSSSIRGVVGIRSEASRMTMAYSELSRLRSLESVAGIQALAGSELALDDVWFVENRADGLADTAGLVLSDSAAYAVDSVWLGNSSFRAVTGASGSRFVAVSSHWEDNGGETSTLVFSGGGGGILVNSSFVGNRAPTEGIVVADGAPLEVVNATFVDNVLGWPTPGTYPIDLRVRDGGTLSLYNSFSNAGENSVFEPYAGAGNCIVDPSAPIDLRAESGYTEAYFTPDLGCADVGDTSAAEEAMRVAEDFGVALGGSARYGSGFWRSTTSTLAACSDTPPVDAGRHYVAPGCGER